MYHRAHHVGHIGTNNSWFSYAMLALIVFIASGFLLSVHSYAATQTDSLELKGNTRVQAGNSSLALDTGLFGGGALRFGGKNIPLPLKIMPLGDSITAGVAIDPQLAYSGSYRTKLWQLLTGDGMSIDYVGKNLDGPADLLDHDHEGYSGIWIKDNRVLSRYTLYDTIIDSLNTYNPNLILLHAGTNDLNSGDSNSLTAQKLDALLGRIFATKPDVHVVMALIIPPQPSRSGWQDYNILAKKVADLYALRGYHIAVADMNNILVASDYADYLHPVKSGYDKMAVVWYSAIQVMLREW